MSMATRTDTKSPALHVTDSHDLIHVQGARENNPIILRSARGAHRYSPKSSWPPQAVKTGPTSAHFSALSATNTLLRESSSDFSDNLFSGILGSSPHSPARVPGRGLKGKVL
jgi:hypothetical protein